MPPLPRPPDDAQRTVEEAVAGTYGYMKRSDWNALVAGAGSGGASEALLTQIRDYLDTVETKLQSIINGTDGLEGFTDGLEGLITSTNGLLTTIRDNADTVETLLTSLGTNTDGVEALLTTIRDNADTVETKLQSLIDLQKGATSSVTSVAASASSVTLLASNAARIHCVVFNDSADTLFVKEGAIASATSFTYRLDSNESEKISHYKGVIDGIWSIATGSARVTETTA